MANGTLLSFVTAVFLLLVDQTATFAFFHRPGGIQEVLTTPRLVSYSNSDWRRHKRSVAILPDHVTINVNVGDDEAVNLWVTRSEDNTLNVQHHHLTNKPPEDFPHQNVEVYSNGTTKTVMVIQQPNINRDDVKVTGSFQHGSKSYYIQPLDTFFNSSNDFRHAIWSFDNRIYHDQENTGQIPKVLNRTRRESFSMRLENTIEVFAVVDYKDYMEYTRRFPSNEAAAKTMITSNLAYSVESANMRLQSLRTQVREAVLRVVLVGVMILTDSASSSFTETNAREDILDEASAFTAFRRFLSENQQRLPRADHFLAVTGYQLGQDPDVLALEARVGSMCSPDSITLIRDQFGGVNGMSIAHGLGHSLGALNDEEYSVSTCSGEYVMAQRQTSLDNLAHKGHMFQFSRCSAEDINRNISSPNMACLKRVDVPTGKISPSVSMEATFFNPEQVCFNELGRASDFCRDFYSFDFFEDNCFNAICSVGIFCRIPFSSMCRSVPAFEKLSCGNRKWCVGSQCVADNSARATNGDDIVAYNKINFPCDARLCPSFRKNLGVLYNTNCPLTCPRGTFKCPNVFNVKFPP